MYDDRHAARKGAASLVILTMLCALTAPAAAQHVPEGFRAELVYEAPNVEHPSVVTCDTAGNLFVGEDPMDMRGPATEEFDRVLLIRFDPAGGPPTKTVFCDKLSAVFGLLWHEGALYVMHAPHYSVFRDTDGDGVADERRDLAEGFGPPAGVFGFNDHIVSGIRQGLDGLFYVSVGDKGIARASGADGSTVTLEGGGIVRMRPDGTQLEVFSSGTRNHLDLAFDSLDNIFTYDNTDDGLGWWTRLTHHVPTGYYGYPYDYQQRPERHLPCISDHGGGSPCGAACYRDAGWPAEYRDNAFFCEWGKGKVQRFKFERQGATFTAAIEDFMTGEGTTEFRPLDLCFAPDGRAMYVADWNYGGWMKPDVRGRLYRVTYEGQDAPAEPPRGSDADPIDRQLTALAHPAHSERVRAQEALARLGSPAAGPLAQLLAGDAAPAAKIHAIWAQNALIDTQPGYDPTADWITRLSDADADVRAQAARALGLRRANPAAAALATTLDDEEARVRMQAAIALGRIGDPTTCAALWRTLADEDRFVNFTAMQALRAINHWDDAPQQIDYAYAAPDSGDAASRAVLTLTGLYDERAARALEHVAAHAERPLTRLEAIRALEEVCRQAEPYTGGWWGTQPARGEPARAKKHDWGGTPIVLAAIRAALNQQDNFVREAALLAVMHLDDRETAPRLREIIQTDPDIRCRRVAMATLGQWQDADSVQILKRLAAADAEDGTSETAATVLSSIGTPAAVEALVALLNDPHTPSATARYCLLGVAKSRPTAAHDAVAARLADPDAPTRAAAVHAIAAYDGIAALPRLTEMLADSAPEVRKAVVAALAAFKSPEAVPTLIAAAADSETRAEALAGLVEVPDPRALQQYLAALDRGDQRDRARAALTQIRDQVADDILAMHERGELNPDIFADLDRVYSSPAPIDDWHTLGAWHKNESLPLDPAQPPDLDAQREVGDRRLAWKLVHSDDPAGRVPLHRFVRPNEACWTWAYASLESAAGGQTTLHLGSDDQVTLWINGREIYKFDGHRGWAPDQAEMTVDLQPGVNHLLLLAGNESGPYEFSVQVGRRDPRFDFLAQEVEPRLDARAYVSFAASNPGDAERGKQVFANENGANCVKCHAVGGGAKAGPDLTGVGAKYARDELVRSVLEPSNRILSGYEMSTVVTVEGRVVQGVIKAQTEEFVELVDTDGKTVRLAAADVDQVERSTLSMMPAGLQDKLTPADFADLIAYLASLKDTDPAGN